MSFHIGVDEDQEGLYANNTKGLRCTSKRIGLARLTRAMETIHDIQARKRSGLAVWLPYPVSSPLLTGNWLQRVRIWTCDLILRHAEDKMASLNSVLYFMPYVVKRFVLYVPNLPIVLLTTCTAVKFYANVPGSTYMNYFPDSFVMSSTWEYCSPASICMISNILTYGGSDYQGICLRNLIFSVSFIEALCQCGLML